MFRLFKQFPQPALSREFIIIFPRTCFSCGAKLGQSSLKFSFCLAMPAKIGKISVLVTCQFLEAQVVNGCSVGGFSLSKLQIIPPMQCIKNHITQYTMLQITFSLDKFYRQRCFSFIPRFFNVTFFFFFDKSPLCTFSC